MNPWTLVGALVLYIGSSIGLWFYKGHEDALACTARVNAVQLNQSQDDLHAAKSDIQASTATAANTDQTTEQHHETEQSKTAAAQQAQVQIRYIHDHAAASDCLRQPVDSGIDLQLRDNASGTSGDPAAAGSAPG